MDEPTREEIKELKTRISDLGTTFTSNLNEENTILEFSVEELDGVPQDLINSFEKVTPHFNRLFFQAIGMIREHSLTL